MKNFFTFWTMATAALVFSAKALADPVAVKLDGVSYTQANPHAGDPVVFGAGSTPNVTIDLGSDVAVTRNIHIYDPDTANYTLDSNNVRHYHEPTGSIGTLTLVGTATAMGRVNVLVAGPLLPSGVSTVFPPTTAYANTLVWGIKDFGGTTATSATQDYSLQSHEYDAAPWATSNSLNIFSWSDPNLRGLIIADPSLRRQAVVAIVVSNDICTGLADGGVCTGRIEAGQILRVAALGKTENGVAVGGNINAHIIADARDFYLSYADVNSPPTPPAFINLWTPNVLSTTTGFKAIETVTAGNAIRGKVIAFGRAKDDSGLSDHEYALDPGPEPEVINLATQVQHAQWLDKFWINRGGIQNIYVSTTPTAGDTIGTLRGGIQNDIISELGRIYSVRTLGTIAKRDTAGNEDNVNMVNIHAADGVLEVLAANPADTAQTVEKNFRLDVRSNLGVQKHEIVLASSNDYSSFPYSGDGTINLIETKGFLYGTIVCDNLWDHPDKRDSMGRSGIIAYGGAPGYYWNPVGGVAIPDDFDQGPKVGVKYIARNVNILSYHIEELSVGLQFKGAAVAFGTAGNDTDDPSRGEMFTEIGILGYPEGTEDTDHPYGKVMPGLVGGFSDPLDMRPGPYSTTDGLINDTTPPTTYGTAEHPLVMKWDADRWLYAKPSHPDPNEDGGAVDSVVRAERRIFIKSIIYQMTQRIEKSLDEVAADHRPRLEAPVIDNLKLHANPSPPPFDSGEFPNPGGLLGGVIWSGRLPYTTHGGDIVPDEGPAAMDGWYTSANHVEIAKIAPPADFWAHVYDLEPLEIRGDMGGELHALGVNGNGMIRIGGGLLDANTFPDDYLKSQQVEKSPRGYALIAPNTYDDPCVPFGSIYVRPGPNAGDFQHLSLLEGPIILNAAGRPDTLGQAPSTEFWQGLVRVGDLFNPDSNHPVIWLGQPGLVPEITRQDEAPEYEREERSLSANYLNYPNSSDPNNIGKWAGAPVGVAPFAVHDEQCLPPNEPDQADPPTIVGEVDRQAWINEWAALGQLNHRDDPRLYIKFYGPIKMLNNESGQPTIEYYDVGETPHVWTTVSGPGVSDPLFDVRCWTPPIVGGNRSEYLIIGPKCVVVPLGFYRVSNTLSGGSSGIRCRFVQGDPQVFWPGEPQSPSDPPSHYFYFRLVTGLRGGPFCADIGIQGGTEGSDGLFDNNDWAVFINRFFALDPRADIGVQGGTPGQDGLLDNNDFVVFINMFFAGDDPQYCNPFLFPCTTGFAGRSGESEGGESAPAGAMNRSTGGPDVADPDQPERTIADVIASLQQAINAMPPGPQRTQMEQLLQALQAAP